MDEDKSDVVDDVVHKLCRGLGNDWFRLALQLGFSHSQLEDLSTSFELEPRCQAVARMLYQWCHLVSARHGKSQTRVLLTSVLRDIERNDLAEEFGDGTESNVEIPPRLEDDLVTSIKNLCLCPGAVSNGQAQLNSRIEKWKRDCAIFHETRAYSHVKKLLFDTGTVTVIGKQGDGKTAIAEQLALTYLAQGYDVVIVSSPEEWKEKWNPEKKQIVFMDDVFGRNHVFSDVTLEQWTFRGEEMRECNERGRTKVISTVRDYIFNDCRQVRNVELFKTVVNVSSEPWKLDADEKYEILKRHLVNNQLVHLDERTTKEIARRDCVHGFPLRCRLFVSDRRLQDQGFTFFSRRLPDILTDELRYMKKHSRLKYAALVLLMLCDGNIADSQFQDDDNNKTWISHLLHNLVQSVRFKQSKQLDYLFVSLKCELSLPPETTLAKMKESLLTMTGSYVIYFDRQFKFVHDCMSEAVASLFGNCATHQTFFVDHCSVSALQQYVYLDNEPNEQAMSVCLHSESYCSLAQRLTKEIASGSGPLLLQTNQFASRKFTDVWIKLLSSKHCQEVKSLFLQKDKHNRTLLQWAVKSGNINLLRFYLACDVCPSQLMLDAASLNQTASVKFLLAKGADVNACKNSGQTALLLAATHGNVLLTELLLEKGASVNMADQKGCNPLHSACVQGFQQIVELLIEHKANVNNTDNNDCTALFHASCHGHLHLVKLLLQNGADPSIRNNLGGSPFFASCVNGHWDIANILLRENADLSARDYTGRTALHWACLRRFENVVQLLVNNGADTGAVDHRGRTPVHYAAVGGNRRVWRVLLNAGADVFVTDNDGCMPVHLANRESKIHSLFGE